jgi:hypothetical protein
LLAAIFIVIATLLFHLFTATPLLPLDYLRHYCLILAIAIIAIAAFSIIFLLHYCFHYRHFRCAARFRCRHFLPLPSHCCLLITPPPRHQLPRRRRSRQPDGLIAPGLPFRCCRVFAAVKVASFASRWLPRRQLAGSRLLSASHAFR